MSDTSGRGKRLIAVCGKGGTGKTALTAMMARALLKNGAAGKLLLIDADPAMGLINALGTDVRRTIGQVREEIIKTAKKGKEEEKAQLVYAVDYMAFEALNELEDFAVLAMGRTETLGCFCPVNALLREAVQTLSKSFDTILIDGEAGLEQLNRQVVNNLSTLVIVSDPTSRGLETAALIKKMIEVEKVIECHKMGLVFNRVQGNEKILVQSADKLGLEILGFIPYDENIVAYDLMGKPIIDLPEDSSSLAEIYNIVENRLLRY